MTATRVTLTFSSPHAARKALARLIDHGGGEAPSIDWQAHLEGRALVGTVGVEVDDQKRWLLCNAQASKTLRDRIYELTQQGSYDYAELAEAIRAYDEAIKW